MASSGVSESVIAKLLNHKDHGVTKIYVRSGYDPEKRIALDAWARTLMTIIESIPDLRAFDGGSLENAIGMETFAAVLLTINIRHKVRAGLRLSGI